MKNYTIVISMILILFSSMLLAQQGWVSLHSVPDEYDLKSVFFTSPDTGFILGIKWDSTQTNIIGKTDDGGVNWNISEYPDYNLNDMNFFNKLVGFIVGYDGTILKSSDGGETWNVLNFDSTIALKNIWITNDTLGYISTGQNYFLKTVDGGITWNVINTNVIGMQYLCFPSANIGYALKYSWMIYKTIDGGLNWVEKHNAATHNYHMLYFINPDTGFVPGESWGAGLLLKTYDGLNSYGMPLTSNGWLNDVCFINNDTGFVVGNQGKIFRTDNCGNLWQEQLTPTLSRLNSIYFPTPTTGYAVGIGGTILKTTNGGISGINYIINTRNKNFYLYQNYPNPFNPSTYIKYTLPKTEKVKIDVFDLLGQKIETLIDKTMYTGTHKVEFTAKELPSGVYLYRIESGIFRSYKKMILLR